MSLCHRQPWMPSNAGQLRQGRGDRHNGCSSLMWLNSYLKWARVFESGREQNRRRLPLTSPIPLLFAADPRQPMCLLFQSTNWLGLSPPMTKKSGLLVPKKILSHFHRSSHFVFGIGLQVSKSDGVTHILGLCVLQSLRDTGSKRCNFIMAMLILYYCQVARVPRMCNPSCSV